MKVASDYNDYASMFDYQSRQKFKMGEMKNGGSTNDKNSNNDVIFDLICKRGKQKIRDDYFLGGSNEEDRFYLISV